MRNPELEFKQQHSSTSTSNKQHLCGFVANGRNSSGNRTNTNPASDKTGGKHSQYLLYIRLLLGAVSARHDLDGRHVISNQLVDAHCLGDFQNARLVFTQPDGLCTYSETEQTSVSPIYWHKVTMAIIPHDGLYIRIETWVVPWINTFILLDCWNHLMSFFDFLDAPKIPLWDKNITFWPALMDWPTKYFF